MVRSSTVAAIVSYLLIERDLAAPIEGAVIASIPGARL